MRGRLLFIVVFFLVSVLISRAYALEGFVGVPQAVNIRARTVVNVALKREKMLVPIGSGVIIDNRGYVLTVAAGITEQSPIVVTLWDESRFPARLIGVDRETDLAMLKIESEGPFPIATMKRSGSLSLGSDIFVLANPFGKEHMVAKGIVSYKMRLPSHWDTVEVYISDAIYMNALKGAPVFDENVEMVGLVTDIFKPLSFSKVVFVSWREIQKILPMLKEGRVVKRGWFGISARGLSSEETVQRGLPFNHGIEVLDIQEGSPASLAGLQRGDIILEVDDTLIRDISDLKKVIQQTPAGVAVSVKFYREGKMLMVNVVPQPASSFVKSPEDIIEEAMGVDIMELTPEISGLVGLPPAEAIFIKKVKPGSLAESFNLKDGDIILEVNSKPIKSLLELARLFQNFKEGQSIMLKIKRRNGYAYINFGIR